MVRQYLNKGVISLEFVKSERNLVDPLTNHRLLKWFILHRKEYW